MITIFYSSYDVTCNPCYGRRDIFRNKRYEELCVVSVWKVRDGRSTDERAKRRGIKIEMNWAEN